MNKIILLGINLAFSFYIFFSIFTCVKRSVGRWVILIQENFLPHGLMNRHVIYIYIYIYVSFLLKLIFIDRIHFTSKNFYQKKVVPVLVDQTFANLLKKYAMFIAKIVLKKRFAGVCLSEDVKKALAENLERLRESIAAGQISRELIEEYKKIFKQIFAKACKLLFRR